MSTIFMTKKYVSFFKTSKVFVFVLKFCWIPYLIRNHWIYCDPDRQKKDIPFCNTYSHWCLRYLTCSLPGVCRFRCPWQWRGGWRGWWWPRPGTRPAALWSARWSWALRARGGATWRLGAARRGSGSARRRSCSPAPSWSQPGPCRWTETLDNKKQIEEICQEFFVPDSLLWGGIFMYNSFCSRESRRVRYPSRDFTLCTIFGTLPGLEPELLRLWATNELHTSRKL